MEPNEFEAGDLVIYKPRKELGTVIRATKYYVMVEYDGQPKATYPGDLKHLPKRENEQTKK